MPPPPDWLTEFWSVPRIWPGETVAILCGGESLTPEDVNYLRDRCRVIAINRAYVRAPWADWLFACDAGRFWQWCGGPGRLYPAEPDAWDFAGLKITVWSPSLIPPHVEHLRKLLDARPEVRVIRHAGDNRHEGESGDPGVLYGNNSLYQLLSVIRFTGARRVLLLGADMLGGHWHPPWPMGGPNFPRSVVPKFTSLVEPLARAKVEVINCSPGSALEAFPKRELREVL